MNFTERQPFSPGEILLEEFGGDAMWVIILDLRGALRPRRSAKRYVQPVPRLSPTLHHYRQVFICPPSLNQIGEVVGNDKAVAHPTQLLA